MKRPVIQSEWKVLFHPEKNGNYVNDHCIFKAPLDDKWHLFGITGFGGGSYTERYFVHASGADLAHPMEELGRSIDRGTLAWSPCVVRRGEYYYMFYGPSPSQMAVSPDLCEWFGYPMSIAEEPPMAVHRDHFVLQRGENDYLMYVSGIKDKRGSIALLSSHDLLHWRFDRFALTSGPSAPLHPAWGAMESPFIVQKDGHYYLFVTYTDCEPENYNDTLVFVSDDPTDFGCYDPDSPSGAVPVAKLKAHAPEIIEENGQEYITTCGWGEQDVPIPGCVCIARLGWEE